jgi:hypothetical protein
MMALPSSGLPELVEGLSSLFGEEEGKGFDRLSQAGLGIEAA